jgi:hypothetical protein
VKLTDGYLAIHRNDIKHLDLEAKNILYKSHSKYPELFLEGFLKAKQKVF